MNWRFDEDTFSASTELLSRLECLAADADTRGHDMLRACAEALRMEIDKSQRLLDAVDTIIVGLDPEGRVTLINRKGCELLGRNETDLVGKFWFEACLPPSADSAGVLGVFRRIMAGELAGVEYYENEVLTATGEHRMVAWRNNYFRAADGRVLGTLSAGEDVTERRRAEAALRESEARLDHLLTSSPAVIYSYRAGASRETTFVSENIRDQMGYSPRECISDRCFWRNNIHPDDRLRVLKSVHRSPRTGKHCDEYRFRHADGGWRWIRDERKLLRDASGRAEEFVGSWSDVTDRKDAEEKTATLLAENRKLMQQLFSVQEAERRRLARELHDEFGQWLSAVQANATAVAGLGADRLADIRESAAAIGECIGEVQAGIRHLIRDLRPAALDQLGLQDGLRELVAQWQSHHPRIRCSLTVTGAVDDIGESLAITVYRLVQEALTNVARHARARRAVVELHRVRPDAGELLKVVIRDDGIGMRRNDRPAGMGLLGMRERVLAAGGTYQVNTGPNQGFAITITLPLHDVPAAGEPR